MSWLSDLTAAELAACLDMAAAGPPNTGALSQLDEATLEFGWRHESVGPAQKAMAEARHAHIRSYRAERGDYAPEAWTAAAAAAHALAVALRPLGDTAIARCKREAGHGTCGIALDDDGECRSTLGHIIS
jgi:hypothetical protein